MICLDGLEYDIDFSTKIGSGSYGNVHPGRTRTGRNVAVKLARDQKEIEAAVKEVEFYRRCAGGKNIVKYIGSERKGRTNHSPERFTFAMERALFSLDKLMKQVRNLKGLSKEIVVDFLVDCVSALTTLKECGIAHRDIKHLNILVFPGSTKGRRSRYLFKFCDMGVSSFVHEDGVMQTLVGTPNNLCPEMAIAYAQRQRKTNGNYTREEVDLWSFGCTLYFVATAVFPFPIDRTDNCVLAYAVAEENRPEGAICAERICGDSNRYMYRYGYTIDNPSVYPKWFSHSLSKIIAMLFSRDRSLETLDKLANVLRDSLENKFISIESTDIYNYCDLSGVPEFRAGYPTPKEELGLKAGVKYRLLHENRITEFSNSFEKPTHGSPPILFPLLDDIPWTPKKWGLSLDEGRQTNGEQSNYGHRMAAFAQAGEALKDCEKISEIVATSSTTIRTLLDMIKIELESARERTLIPVRFTTYAKMHSFALTPFVRDESQKVVMDRIFEVADEAAKTLEVCTEFFNKALADIVVHLKELNSIELDIDEEPRLEDELNSMLNDAPPDGLLEYEKELINHCLIRRASLASQLCSNSDNSIVRVLLRAARFAVDLRTELTRYEKCVDDCTMQIERPFQELKSCVVRMQADMNLDELSFRKAVNYYKRPSNIINHTRQIHGQVHRLLQLIQQGGEPSQ